MVYLGVPVAALIVHETTGNVVLGLIYMFLIIPMGILQAIDFYRTNDGTTAFSRVFNALFRVPIALFGLVCGLVGITIIGWVLYNIFVERQKEYSGPSFVFGLGSFGVGVPLIIFGWFALRSAFKRKPEFTPEDQGEFDHEEDDEEEAARKSQAQQIRDDET